MCNDDESCREPGQGVAVAPGAKYLLQLGLEGHHVAHGPAQEEEDDDERFVGGELSDGVGRVGLPTLHHHWETPGAAQCN